MAVEPLNLNATYKSPTSISLEWTFALTHISYSYVAYYQSGGEGYSVAFTIDSLERDNRHELTGLPVGGVHSISLVALVDLPSPVAGPVTPGELHGQLCTRSSLQLLSLIVKGLKLKSLTHTLHEILLSNDQYNVRKIRLFKQFCKIKRCASFTK